MTDHVETRHEVPNRRRIADARPWEERAQEWLSVPFNMLCVIVPLCAVMYKVPLLAVPGFIAYLGVHFAVGSMKALLPYRYPARYRGEPAADPATGKPANGISYIGAVRSTSPFEEFKEAWLADDDWRKHWFVLGSTGSGKSETLKGFFFNALCWGSGFFAADGKADNKLPTDGYTMAKAFGRDDAILHLNFLLGGRSPQQVAKSRRRTSNGFNSFSGADADTCIQMGANLLPKAEGEGKSWQEKALNFWRALVVALCYKRDTQGMTISVSTFIEYMSLSRVEELYLEGYDEAARAGGVWSYGFAGIKNYLDSGCPAYRVDRLLKKHGRGQEEAAPASAVRRGAAPSQDAGAEQENMAYEQHAYRTNQLMPVLNLLDKTYSHIFSKAYPEIDMVDIALHNRILFMLIPSLEKSPQEAENLGKLAIACLRVMMAKNLGAGLEGTYEELLGSKATNAPYPFVAALDELGYYFSDGIAVMFAQARSMGVSMIAAAQDLEKLTEGTRGAEAGAMLGNTVNKIFHKIDDPKKTWELVSATVGKAWVAVYKSFSYGAVGWKREAELGLEQVERVSYQEMQNMKPGQAVMNALGTTKRLTTFFIGDWIAGLNNKTFHINRFLQVSQPTVEDMRAASMAVPKARTESQFDGRQRLLRVLRGQADVLGEVTPNPMVKLVAAVAAAIPSEVGPFERGILLYQAACSALNLSSAFSRGLGNEQPKPEAPRDGGSALGDYGRVSGAAKATGGGGRPGGTQHAKSVPDAGADPFYAPDPMALIRKAGHAVLGAPPGLARLAALGEMPRIGLPPAPGKNVNALDGLPPHVPTFWDSATEDDSDVALSEEALSPDEQETFIEESLMQAHNMLLQPRSDDRTVVAIADAALDGLVAVETALGNPDPDVGAHTMQKVVAVAATPDTIARERISAAEIDRYFDELEAGLRGGSGAAPDVAGNRLA